MSSLVEAKWVSSAMWSRPEGVQPVAEQVLDRLHVVPRDRLELGQPVDLVLAEVVDQPAEARPARAVSGMRAGQPASVRAMSHSTSTCSRARLRPASERCSARPSTAGGSARRAGSAAGEAGRS